MNVSSLSHSSQRIVRSTRQRFLRLSRRQQLASAALSLLLLSGALFALAELGGYGVSGPDAAPNALDRGLVGYWNMEEGGGQTVHDRSGQGNDGTLGSTAGGDANDPAFGPGHDASGPTGSGLVFDGTERYVNAGSDSSLDITGAITMSVWVKPSVSDGNLLRKVGVSQGYMLHLMPNRVVQLGINEFDSYLDTTTDAFPLNEWSHLVATVDAGGAASIFVNGTLAQAGSLQVLNSTTTNQLIIGGQSWNTGQSPTGAIDEVRLYNRALSADEVRLLYNQKRPVLEYGFDEGAGSVAHDASFNGNDGAINGAGWAPGWAGMALSFDGSNDSVSRALTDSLKLTDALSVSAWFNPSEVALANRGLVTWNEGGGFDNGWTLAESAGGVVFSIRSSDGVNKSVAVPGGTLSSGTFYHAMGVFDGNNLFLYLDGKLIASDSYGATKTIQQSSNDIVVGMESGRYFNGLIDSVRIYDYARSADEVLSDYNGGLAAHLGAGQQDLNFGLVGYWNMEEGGGQTVHDRSGQGNDGTLGYNTSVEGSDPAFGPGHDASGPTGTGISFDGMNDVVGVDTANGFDAPTGLSVGGWIKPSINSSAFPTGGWNYYSRGYWTSIPYEFGHWGNGNSVFKVYNAAGSSFSVTTTQGLTADTWYHVFASVDAASGALRLYINGRLVNSNSNFTGALPGLTSLIIGGGSGGCAFPGTIDDFRLYGRALSDDEVRMLYNQKRPVAEYGFDEGAGAAAHDASFNGNDGAIQGAVWAAGKSGTALSFDGTDDYVDIPHAASLDIAQNLTVGAWIQTSYTGGTQMIAEKTTSAYNTGYNILITGSGFEGRLYPSSIASTVDVRDGAWHHVVMTNEAGAANGWNLYVDGKVAASATGVSIGSNANNLIIGRRMVATSLPFNGLIDSVRIYDYARSADEVLSDYNDGKAVHLGKNNQDLSYGLVGHWNMEEGGGQTVHDRSGQGNDGTLGSTAGADAADPAFGPGHDPSGPTGSGLVLDGTNDYVNIGGAASLKLANAGTIAAWIYPTSSSGLRVIYGSSGSADVNKTPYFRIESGTLRAYLGNGTAYNNISSGLTPTLNAWSFVVLSWDGSNVRMFLNGAVYSVAQTYPVNFTAATYALGKQTPWADRIFQGSLDEVRLYNRALSADEVRMLYNQKQPILEYKFEEGTGTVAYDESFQNHDGTIYGATWADGKFGSALAFDGANGYVAFSDPLLGAKEMTACVWAQKSIYRQYQGFIADYQAVNGSRNFILGYESPAGTLRFYVGDGTAIDNIGITGFTSDAWHHVCGTFGAGQLAIYLDGVAASKSTTIANIGSAQSSACNIGNYANGYPFGGLLDEVRLYDYARTAAEIQADYNAGLAAHLR